MSCRIDSSCLIDSTSELDCGLEVDEPKSEGLGVGLVAYDPGFAEESPPKSPPDDEVRFETGAEE